MSVAERIVKFLFDRLSEADILGKTISASGSSLSSYNKNHSIKETLFFGREWGFKSPGAIWWKPNNH